MGFLSFIMPMCCMIITLDLSCLIFLLWKHQDEIWGGENGHTEHGRQSSKTEERRGN